MKRLVFVISFLILFCATGFAQAREHVVKKGECLSVIAKQYGQKWQTVYQANKGQVRNPDLIYPGQKLQIPEKGIDEGKTASKPFSWEKPGANKFVGHDFAKVINMFNLLEEVRAAMIEKVKSGQFEWHQIASGDHFEQMVFGRYKMVNDVRAKWDAGKLFAAKKWSVEYDNKIFYLAEPSICRNWAWWSEVKKPEAPLETVVMTNVPRPSPPPSPPPEPEKKKQLLTLLIPLPMVEEAAVIAEIPAPEYKSYEPYYEHETFGWYGFYLALEGDGKSAYVGGKHNSFFARQTTANGVYREGLGLTANAWRGINDDFMFRGDRFSIGPVADLTGKSGTRTVVTVQVGKQRDFGNDSLGYSARQDTDILLVGLSNDLYQVGPFNKVESWGDLNIDIGHEKESSWQGWKIPQDNDPAEDKTGLAVGSRLYFWQTDGLKGGLVGKGTYAFGDHGVGIEAGPFLARQDDMIKVGAGWRYQFNSAYENNNGHMIGAGADIDLEKLFSMISAYVKSINEKKEEQR